MVSFCEKFPERLSLHFPANSQRALKLHFPFKVTIFGDLDRYVDFLSKKRNIQQQLQMSVVGETKTSARFLQTRDWFLCALWLLGNVLSGGRACRFYELKCESSAPLMGTRWDFACFFKGGQGVDRQRETLLYSQCIIRRV